MMNRDQLAKLLREANVEDLAREADVSTKTIYRLRHKANAPMLETVEKLVAALERLKPTRRKRRAGAV